MTTPNASAGGWLDPEPPHAEHTTTECRRRLPELRDADHGRRYRCGVCRRVYRAHHSEQREPQPYWVGPLRDEDQGQDGPHSRSCGIAKHDHGTSCRSDCPTCHGRVAS